MLYNHHQSGPAGTVFWSPPFRDPFNYNQDPLLVLGLQQLGLAIHSRLAAEGKPGASARAARRLRRLVERRHPQHRGVSQHPGDSHRDDRQPDADADPARPAAAAADERPDLPDRAAGVALPRSRSTTRSPPIARSSTTPRAGARRCCFNIYRMGKNSIERGSSDTWTPAPHRYAAVAAEDGRAADWRRRARRRRRRTPSATGA